MTYPGSRGRQRAIKLGATDAKKLLQAKLPFVTRMLTDAQIGQVQKVLDAAVVNPVIQREYADASRKNRVAESARGVYYDGAMSRGHSSAQMDRIADELIPITPADKHIRLEHAKLLTYDALKPLTDNADEATYLIKVAKTLSTRGVYLRIEPKLVHPADDASRWVVSDTDFDVFLSLGYDGDTIPSPDGKLTRINLLDTRAIGAGYYREVMQGSLQTQFEQAHKRVSNKISDGFDLHAEWTMNRLKAAPTVVPISDLLGGADFPSEKMWDLPWKLLLTARELNVSGNILAASKQLTLAATIADLASARLDGAINDTMKGAARAAFVAKVVLVVASTLETALNVYALAVTASEIAAGEAALAALKASGKTAASKVARREITREAFDAMLKTGKSTFRRSMLTENLRGEWLSDMNRIWMAAEKRGIELSQKELDALFESAQTKWFSK